MLLSSLSAEELVLLVSLTTPTEMEEALSNRLKEAHDKLSRIETGFYILEEIIDNDN